jgi:hypothetical protein
MKRFIVYALVIVAAWQAWKHYPALIHRSPSHEAVVRNQANRTMERIRLSVDHRTFVKERLASGESVTFPFRVAHDASFGLEWNWSDSPAEAHWSGGRVYKGPIVQRHRITVVRDGGVIYSTEKLAQ